MSALPSRSSRAALACVLCLINCVACASGAVVRIAVTVRTEDGNPLQGSLFRALVDGREPSVIDGIADAHGSLSLQLEVPPEASFVEIRHGFSSPSTIAAADQLRVSEVSSKNKDRHHFSPSFRVSLEPSRIDYELAITAWNAVSAKAVFVNQQRRPLPSASLHGPPISRTGRWDRQQSLPLRGLRRGAAADLAAVARVGPYDVVKPIHVDASRTMGDVDLGEIVFEEPPAGVVIGTKIVGDRTLRSSGVRLGPLPGMTVVSLDGKLIATFRARGTSATETDDAPMELPSSENWKPVLPPGEYLVVPGFFSYDETQAILVRLLAKGVDLSKSDIPRIKVREGAPNDDVVDLVKCHEAIVRFAAREGAVPTDDKSN